MSSSACRSRAASLLRATPYVTFVTLAASIVACSPAPTSPNAAGGTGATADTPSTTGGAGGAGGTTGGASAAIGGAAGQGASAGGTGGASGAAAGSGGAGGSGGASGSSGNGGSSGGGVVSHAQDASFCSSALDTAASDYKGFLQANPDPTKIPRAVSGSTVTTVGIGDWTAGFDAGNLWLLYEHTKDPSYLSAAQAWTNALYSQRLRTDTHDIGFVILSSYAQGYRITQNPDYVAVITKAGQSLSTRFSATVGCTKSWDGTTWHFPVIIDNMMNIELLYRAATLGKTTAYSDMATTHALTTRTNHFRPDFSSYHLVDYDPATGAVLKKQTVQGISDDSAWSRGQAWGLYGFTMSYRESHDQRFLDQALAIADFYTLHPDFPADNVPFFDFSTVQRTDIPDYKDASAGAAAASGLLELANYAPAEAAERYRAFAVKALRSLSSPAYRAAAGENGHFLLMHSVGNYPGGTEIDVAINYADYYYLEALGRCSTLE
jgi:unsaturated chondroitin disaccharide hydrolase